MLHNKHWLIYIAIIPLFLIFCNNSEIKSSNFFVFEVSGIGVSTYVEVKGSYKGIPSSVLQKTIRIDSSLPVPPIEMTKYYRKDQDLYYAEPYSETLEKEVNTVYYNTTADFVILKNMYVSFAGSYTTNDFIYLDVEPNPALEVIRDHSNGKVIGDYPSVIALGHNSVFIYSHWYYDVLAPLVLIPQEIVDSSYILAFQNKQFALDTLLPLGIKEENIIFIHQGEWVYASNLIAAINPTPHIGHFNKATLILSQKLRDYYHLEKIIPTFYYFSNRQGRRMITNLDDIYKAVVNKFPNYKTSIVPDFDRIDRFAKIWAEAKFMFMGTGSNFIKNLFMKEKSVIVVALANSQDLCIARSAASHGVFTLYFVVVGMDHHYDQSGHACDVDLALRVCSIGFYCAEHGQWKSNETFTYTKDSNIS